MHLAFKRSKLLPLLAAFIAGIAFSFAAEPLYKRGLMQLWQAQYAQMTFECDQAMRAHLLAKQTAAYAVNEQNVNALKAAEIGLIDCQDYDLLQKKMKRWGLSDNEISEMALSAIEADGASLRKMIQVHEITY